MPMTLLAAVVVGLSACALPSSSAPSGVAGQASNPPRVEHTLVTAVRSEPNTLAERPIQTAAAFAGLNLVRRFANAELTLLDDKLVRRSYLAEALPQLNSDTWRVSADGQMETTWHLRPGVTWHDGAPFTSQDFTFAWQLYSTPELGAGGSQFVRAVKEVAAPDELTVVIRYKQPYPSADNLTGNDAFPPLPRHILEPALQQGDLNAFANLPFWTREYIGLGPFHLDRWEPGSFMEASAFDQHILGRAKTSRLKIMFVSDVNAALARLLAGEMDLVGDSAIGLEQAFTLKGDWEKRGAGLVRLRTSQWRATAFQLRPELVNPRALLDVRVRRALAHTVDKQSLNDGVYHGEMSTSDYLVSPQSQWGPSVADAVIKYPYDTRRAEQLMNEAGLTRSPDGFFTSPTEGRFKAELKTAESPDWVNEMTIMAAAWRKTGLDIQDAVLPAALSLDPESRVTFPGMFTSTTSQGETALTGYTTAQIPKVEDRWRIGSNRGGWSSPDYDRLLAAYFTTLEPSQRGAQMAQMAKVFTEDMPMISLLFLAQPYAHVSALRGVLPVAPEGDITWNIHEWEWNP
ncbi:MAG TPA: ABC transporter substrate-binding protein [Chloroflexota bacterium]